MKKDKPIADEREELPHALKKITDDAVRRQIRLYRHYAVRTDVWGLFTAKALEIYKHLPRGTLLSVAKRAVRSAIHKLIVEPPIGNESTSAVRYGQSLRYDHKKHSHLSENDSPSFENIVRILEDYGGE